MVNMKAESDTNLSAAGSVLSWPMPAAMPASTVFEVQVRRSGTSVWTDLFVHRVQVGLQGQPPHDSSMALFDFDGSADLRVVYRSGEIRAFDIRPISYGIQATQEGNTLTFTVRQVPEAPRKIVVRINDDWYAGVLHLLSNPPERDAPRLTDAHVYAVEPSEPAPVELPAGKTVYYFKPGLHELPRGLWLDVDLGDVHTIDRVQLEQGKSAVWKVQEIANTFRVEVAVTRDAGFRLACDGTANQDAGSIERTFPPVPARYVRLWLLGSTRDDETALFAALREFRVFAAGGTANLALTRAVGGGLPTFAHATDGNPDTEYTTRRHYGNWHAGESFFVAKHGTTLYLAGGAVLRGSICADEVDDVTVRGRGILDCRRLTHRDQWCEGRAPAIWLVNGNRPVIEGVTIVDAVSWGVLINWSRNGVVRNLNMINNKVNGDGIHVSGSSGALVEGVFVRSPDDLLVSYHFGAPSSGLVARHCVFWADMVQTLLVGMGGGGDIRDYLFHDIDVVNSRGYPGAPLFTGVIKLWANQNCTISNIEFRDIRIDPFQHPEDACVFQIRNDSRERKDFMGPPAGIPGGEIRNLIFRDIVYRGSGENPSLILADREPIHGLLFTRYTRGGRCVERFEDANVKVSGPVEPPEKRFLFNCFARATGQEAP